MGHPVFVTGIDAENNTVTIGESEDVFGDRLVCRGLNFMAVPGMETGQRLRASGKIRYGHRRMRSPLFLIRRSERSRRGRRLSFMTAITSCAAGPSAADFR